MNFKPWVALLTLSRLTILIRKLQELGRIKGAQTFTAATVHIF